MLVAANVFISIFGANAMKCILELPQLLANFAATSFSENEKRREILV
jgi:hypothetical protein